jgi:hypothetical protein
MSKQGVRDEPTDERSGKAEGDREPERHRVRPRDGEPGEPADDEPAGNEQQDVDEQAHKRSLRAALSARGRSRTDTCGTPAIDVTICGVEPPISHRDVTTIMRMVSEIQEDVSRIRELLEDENGE